MCWVMAPLSPSATLVSLIASKSLVLPWSTWPITTTTGGRGFKSATESPCNNSPKSLAWPASAAAKSFDVSCAKVVKPKSWAIIEAVSKSIRSFIEAITPFLNNSPITVVTGNFKISASSRVVNMAGKDAVLVLVTTGAAPIFFSTTT